MWKQSSHFVWESCLFFFSHFWILPCFLVSELFLPFRLWLQCTRTRNYIILLVNLSSTSITNLRNVKLGLATCQEQCTGLFIFLPGTLSHHVGSGSLGSSSCCSAGGWCPSPGPLQTPLGALPVGITHVGFELVMPLNKLLRRSFLSCPVSAKMTCATSL